MAKNKNPKHIQIPFPKLGLSISWSQALRIWSLIDKRNDNECWPWLGSTNTGYARIKLNGKSHYVHRLLYELAVGRPVKDGYNLDHVASRGCTMKHCVNLSHLEEVTVKVNNERNGYYKQVRSKTHCKNGHAYSKHGKVKKNKQTGRTYRVCWTCRLSWQRDHRARAASTGGMQ